MKNYYQSLFSWDALNWRQREMHRYEGGPVGTLDAIGPKLGF